MEKKIYRVEIMTAKNYMAWLTDKPHYSEFYDVEAENSEYAFLIAEHDNPSYIAVDSIEPEVVKEKRYNFSEKDKILSRIIWLVEELKSAIKLYENLDN